MADGDGQQHVSWQKFHEEWRQLTDELRNRDKEQADILGEIRDSLGAMHGRFETLGCGEHIKRVDELSKKLDSMDERILDWPKVAKAVPVFKPKVLMAAAGACAALAGWDWWDRIAAVVEKWLK